jgi:hypothetical protein
MFNFLDIPTFYLIVHPLNYTDLVGNEFEFEDNKILRLSYSIGKPEIKSEAFEKFFLETLEKNKKKGTYLHYMN